MAEVQTYVRMRMLSLAGNPALAHRLGVPPPVLTRAVTEALSEAAGQPLQALLPLAEDSSALQLFFRHECQCAVNQHSFPTHNLPFAT